MLKNSAAPRSAFGVARALWHIHQLYKSFRAYQGEKVVRCKSVMPANAGIRVQTEAIQGSFCAGLSLLSCPLSMWTLVQETFWKKTTSVSYIFDDRGCFLSSERDRWWFDLQCFLLVHYTGNRNRLNVRSSSVVAWSCLCGPRRLVPCCVPRMQFPQMQTADISDLNTKLERKLFTL